MLDSCQTGVGDLHAQVVYIHICTFNEIQPEVIQASSRWTHHPLSFPTISVLSFNSLLHLLLDVCRFVWAFIGLSVMPTTSRRPLSTRTLPLQVPSTMSPSKPAGLRSASMLIKRPRSPDPTGEFTEHQATVKRVRAAPAEATDGEDHRDRERRRVERELQKADFRVKYTRAFPGWVFYFDLDLLDPESAALRSSLAARVMHLKAVWPILHADCAGI
jgi:hypothetical protein